MSTILCPIDFTDNSMNALSYALDLNETLGASLVVMHVYESPALYSRAKFAVNKDLELFREAQSKLDDVYDWIVKKSSFHRSRTEIRLAKGVPWKKIIETVKNKNVRLLVMASSDQTRAERLLLGSNTTGVISKAGCMVIIVPPDSKFSGIDRIVYATDLETGHNKAVATLSRLAKKLDAKINRVHIRLPEANSESPKKQRALQDPTLHVSKSKTVEGGINTFIHKIKGDCLALLHRPRTFFNAFNNASLAKRLSFKCERPLLILHETDKAF